MRFWVSKRNSQQKEEKNEKKLVSGKMRQQNWERREVTRSWISKWYRISAMNTVLSHRQEPNWEISLYRFFFLFPLSPRTAPAATMKWREKEHQTRQYSYFWLIRNDTNWYFSSSNSVVHPLRFSGCRLWCKWIKWKRDFSRHYYLPFIHALAIFRHLFHYCLLVQ